MDLRNIPLVVAQQGGGFGFGDREDRRHVGDRIVLASADVVFRQNGVVFFSEQVGLVFFESVAFFIFFVAVVVGFVVVIKIDIEIHGGQNFGKKKMKKSIGFGGGGFWRSR